MASLSELVKELREKTGAGILDCQKALTENGNSIDKAIDYLRQKGLAAAQKKAGRETNQGLIHAYIHAGGKIGVLIEVNCETDFVARNEQFKAFVNDLALQVAAASPRNKLRAVSLKNPSVPLPFTSVGYSTCAMASVSPTTWRSARRIALSGFQRCERAFSAKGAHA